MTGGCNAPALVGSVHFNNTESVVKLWVKFDGAFGCGGETVSVWPVPAFPPISIAVIVKFLEPPVNVIGVENCVVSTKTVCADPSLNSIL